MTEARNVAEMQRKINAFEPLIPAVTMPPHPPAVAMPLSPGGSVRRLERIISRPLIVAMKPAATQHAEVVNPAPSATEFRIDTLRT
jgi:hypothetical protein